MELECCCSLGQEIVNSLARISSRLFHVRMNLTKHRLLFNKQVTFTLYCSISPFIIFFLPFQFLFCYFYLKKKKPIQLEILLTFNTLVCSYLYIFSHIKCSCEKKSESFIILVRVGVHILTRKKNNIPQERSTQQVKDFLDNGRMGWV